MQPVANRNFNRLVRGKRHAEVPRQMVLDDERHLRDRTQRIVDWTNTYITHHGTNRPPTRLTFRDLRLATAAVIRVANKYAELLNEPKAVMPTILAPWQAIFEVPWIARRRRK
ncbi:MAG TPA: hypothetical protein VEP50_15620 [bacterium]|nr:hypothetical protein [bacterium]